MSLLGKAKRVYLREKQKVQQKAEVRRTDVVFQSFEQQISEPDKNKVWAFCAGQYSNDFRGNPKYLFLYINEYRKDITAYWLCENEDVIRQIRAMGYRAFKLGTLEADMAIDRTGVLVSEQVKGVIPAGLENAKYLNLWHGVGGVKAVERSLTEGILSEELAKKYIKLNAYYRTRELYLAPSAFIEEIACKQLGLTGEQIIHAGYPRCIYQKNYKAVQTFDHEILKARNLPEDTRIAVYAPTYRNAFEGELFARAIPDLQKMISACEKNHILMIFKMHPLLEKEMSFLQAREEFGKNPWILFWDNTQDIYEILEQADLCIMDYSSIFTDFIAAGTRHYLRYVFDFEELTLDFPMGYDEVTVGRKCKNYDELLAALDHYEEEDDSEQIEKIRSLYWEYADEGSMDRIVDSVLNFVPEKKNFPTLYSFDIFDTLISRKVLEPEGIFYYVREKMEESGHIFPRYLLRNYPQIRKNAESNCREYYNRSTTERGDLRCEILFDQILARIQKLYELTDEQTRMLGEWELEAELLNVIPLKAQIDRVKELLSNGEKVVLISDMYLPEEFIRKMLAIADPVLTEIPLFLSSTLGWQKSQKTLYLEVYRQFGEAYPFGRWIHTGDNVHSDNRMAAAMNIETNPIEKDSFNEYERALADRLDSYDGYLTAASMARFRRNHISEKAQFAYSFVSLLFVPYIRWALSDSAKKGKEMVYFISRDGHQLKRIADVINEKDQLGLELKYIYASRRVWRIPSFYDHIDVGFWSQGYGNVAKVKTYSKLLKALDIDEENFLRIFPELAHLKEKEEIEEDELLQMTEVFRKSDKYEEYLLKKAEEERGPVIAYLEQEIDKDKPFSIVEYWGRGYTQENFTRLWQNIKGEMVPSTFYYSRSTLPSDEYNIRENFTSHPSSQSFIESIFANINYKTIEEYQQVNGRWEPVMNTISCDEELFYCMEKYLPEFAAELCEMDLLDKDSLGRGLIDFAIDYFNENPGWTLFTRVLAPLIDSVEMFGKKKEYAKVLTEEDLEAFQNGIPRGQVTKNMEMSYQRSTREVRRKLLDLYQLNEGEDLNSRTVLTQEKIRENAKYADQSEKLMRRIYSMTELYDAAVAAYQVEERILLVTDQKGFSGPEYGSFMQALKEQNRFEVKNLTVAESQNPGEKLAEELAKAKFIISEKPLQCLCHLRLRPETKTVMLGDTSVQYILTGAARYTGLRRVNEYTELVNDSQISVVSLPSAYMREQYGRLYHTNELTEYLPTGTVKTDLLFNNEEKKKARKRVEELFPEAKGRKIVFYAPFIRLRREGEECQYAMILNLKRMQEALEGEYVVIMHNMNTAAGIRNQYQINGFSKDLTKEMSIRRQMLAADVIVGDYRDSLFESPLLGVPTFVTCRDVVSFQKKYHTFRAFEEMLYGMPVAGTSDMVAKLKNLDAYDPTLRDNFKNKYLSYCDGHSAQRLVDWLAKR